MISLILFLIFGIFSFPIITAAVSPEEQTAIRFLRSHGYRSPQLEIFSGAIDPRPYLKERGFSLFTFIEKT